MAHGQANAEIVNDGSPSLTRNHEAPILFDIRNSSVSNVSMTLQAGSKDHGWALNNQPLLWEMSHTSEVVRESGEVAPTLRARMGIGGNQVPMIGIRRLTPTECSRLQGFPDDWNNWLSDSVRYRQFGNAVAVPVIEWIAKRMALANR